MVDVPLEQFEGFVADALDAVPDEFADRVVNVAFLVEEVAEGGNLLGRYEGVPLPSRRAYGGPAAGAFGVGSGSVTMPDRIVLFRRTICAACSTEDEVRALVYATVVHELGHYFGLGDERLRELGW